MPLRRLQANHKQLKNHPTQPTIPSLMVIPRIRVLPDGETIDGHRARMHGQIVGLRERFADVARERRDKIGARVRPPVRSHPGCLSASD